MSDFKWPRRIAKAFEAEGLGRKISPAELAKLTDYEFSEIPGIGVKSAQYVRDVLHSHGLAFVQPAQEKKMPDTEEFEEPIIENEPEGSAPAPSDLRSQIVRIGDGPVEEVGHEVDAEYVSKHGAGTYQVYVEKQDAGGTWKLISAPRFTIRG
jgi:hypothetical protein